MNERYKQNYQSVRITHRKKPHALLTENLCSLQASGVISVLSHGGKFS